MEEGGHRGNLWRMMGAGGEPAATRGCKDKGVSYDDLVRFVRFHTQHHDESHDVSHAVAVYDNAVIIAHAEYPEYDQEILMYASLLHDVTDHKYEVTSLTVPRLHDFIRDNLNPPRAQSVIDIIDNISFSKEVAGARDPSVPQPYLDIISDADRLEAIGEVGIRRCMAYTRRMNGRIPRDVIAHCHDKLLRLYADSFIRTETARRMAEPLHRIVLDFVSTFSDHT
jgi:uncharacterized protein